MSQIYIYVTLFYGSSTENGNCNNFDMFQNATISAKKNKIK